MQASPTRIFQHFRKRMDELNVVANADGTQPDPIAATAALMFNIPEAQVTFMQRESVKGILHMEAGRGR